MPEIKKVWVVRDADASNLDDPAITDEEHLLQQFMWEMDIHKFVRVIMGSPGNTWEAEHSKVYDDEASARKDAEKRLVKLRKGKKTGGLNLVARVVDRFREGH